MHDDDRLGARPDRFLDARRIDRVGGLVDVDQNRLRSAGYDRGDRGERRVRDRDDLITRGDPERAQCEDQRIGAAADPHGTGDATMPSEGALEILDLAAENVSATLQDASDCVLDLALVRAVLRRREHAPRNHATTFTSGT